VHKTSFNQSFFQKQSSQHHWKFRNKSGHSSRRICGHSSRRICAWSDKTSDTLAQLHELYRVVLWENIVLSSAAENVQKPADEELTGSIQDKPTNFVGSDGENLVNNAEMTGAEFLGLPSFKINTYNTESLADAMEIDSQPSCSGKSVQPETVCTPDRMKPYVEMSLKYLIIYL